MSEPFRPVGTVKDFDVESSKNPHDRVIEVIPLGRASNDGAQIQIAKRFVDGVVAGHGVRQSAADAGSTLEVLQRDNTIREYIRKAKRKYAASAEEVAEAVTLQWLTVAFEDPDPKMRMAALHELSAIPAVGLKTGKPGAGQDRRLSDETSAVLDTLEAEEETK